MRRWTVGNLALGFSAFSASINSTDPLCRRLAADTINTMAQGEAISFNGRAANWYRNRWGDYSALTVDPVDDCTFWYTQEYYATTAIPIGGPASGASSLRAVAAVGVTLCSKRA